MGDGRVEGDSREVGRWEEVGRWVEVGVGGASVGFFFFFWLGGVRSVGVFLLSFAGIPACGWCRWSRGSAGQTRSIPLSRGLLSRHLTAHF
jgi:hypothetical protein